MKKNNNVSIQEVTTAEKEETTREEKPQKSIVEKYADFKQALYKVGIVILYMVISIPICIGGAYDHNTVLYGDGPVNYSEDEYDIMKVALEGSPKEENQENKTEENPEEGIEPCLIEDIGLDIKEFRKYVTDYEIYTEGQKTILRAWRTTGSFVAEITVTLDENYHVIDTKKNYENKAQYMKQFYKKLRNDSIVDGLAAWGALTAALYFAINIVMWVVKKISDMRRRKIERTKKEAEITKEQNNIDESSEQHTTLLAEDMNYDSEGDKSSITSIADKRPNESAS
ncbi:MAG: hypothetical protein HFJ47_02855 [Clostridia bacterium]|nr:hypothetical protein [Clostridia bacterium]